MNKKIIVIIILIAVIAGISLYWISQYNSRQSIDSSDDSKKEETVAKEIEKAFYEKFPNWNQSITNIKIELLNNGNSLGRMNYENSEYIWFAAKRENAWQIVEYGTSYNGICQNFEEFDYPKDITPDCWNNESKKLIDTSNPGLFYSHNFTAKDKQEILQSFGEYINQTKNNDSFYENKELYVKIEKNTDKYFLGSILIGGLDNISAPYTLAVKINGEWKVVFQGQDFPDCDIVDGYEFPSYYIDKCLVTQNGKVTTKDR